MSLSDQQQYDIIIKHIDRIAQFMKGRTRKDLEEDLLLEQGINMSLALIGEAAVKISSSFKSSHADIPWRDITNFRNRIVHDYDSLDFKIVYQVIKKFLPELKKKLLAVKPLSETNFKLSSSRNNFAKGRGKKI